MKTSERLVKKFRADPRQLTLLPGNVSLASLAKTAANALDLIEHELQWNDSAREEARLILGKTLPPFDFQVGCECSACAARRKEWQAAKNGGLP